MRYRRAYYVCFRKADNRGWWSWISDEHIYLITACTKQSCVMIDPSRGGLGVWGYDMPARELVGHHVKMCNDIYRVLVTEHEVTREQWKLGRSCVDIAKELLGIDKWWVVTPQQLRGVLSCQIGLGDHRR